MKEVTTFENEQREYLKTNKILSLVIYQKMVQSILEVNTNVNTRVCFLFYKSVPGNVFPTKTSTIQLK